MMLLRLAKQSKHLFPKSLNLQCGVSLSIGTAAGMAYCNERLDCSNVLTNWSNSHNCYPSQIYEPTSVADVERIVCDHHNRNRKIRCIGSGLSPNGLGFCDENESLIRLTDQDKILKVDGNKVKVQAGMIVQDFLDELRKLGLTMKNVASIREQQIGGLVQAGCHGTGASISPIDDHIVEMEMVTPGMGTLILSKRENPRLFEFAKCGLGAFGVVTNVTLECTEIYYLEELTYVVHMDELEQTHQRLLKQNLHLRYMWIPYTDHVVVVACKKVDKINSVAKVQTDLSIMQELYANCLEANKLPQEYLTWSMTELRDRLLELDNLNVDHIKKINQAELAYWKSAAGKRVDRSDEIVGFDCGGQQLVLEVAFPCDQKNSDLKFVQELIRNIEKHKIPAPAPIEQRWSASSKSCMSPAYSNRDDNAPISWVGIVQYLPSPVMELRNTTIAMFKSYSDLLVHHMKSYQAIEHWAKIEIPSDIESRKELKRRLGENYPLKEFNELRTQCDPKGIFANELVLLLKEE